MRLLICSYFLLFTGLGSLTFAASSSKLAQISEKAQLVGIMSGQIILIDIAVGRGLGSSDSGAMRVELQKEVIKNKMEVDRLWNEINPSTHHANCYHSLSELVGTSKDCGNSAAFAYGAEGILTPLEQEILPGGAEYCTENVLGKSLKRAIKYCE